MKWGCVSCKVRSNVSGILLGKTSRIRTYNFRKSCGNNLRFCRWLPHNEGRTSSEWTRKQQWTIHFIFFFYHWSLSSRPHSMAIDQDSPNVNLSIHFKFYHKCHIIIDRCMLSLVTFRRNCTLWRGIFVHQMPRHCTLIISVNPEPHRNHFICQLTTIMGSRT